MADIGKWSQKGVLHSGWLFVGEENLDRPDETCQMCERGKIRFVHIMKHPEYPDILRCGRDCAGRMEGDTAAADARDIRMRNAARRRRKFLTRKTWKTSQNGDLHIGLDGYHVIVSRNPDGYGVAVVFPKVLQVIFRISFDTENAAKLAAFDKVMELKAARR